MIAGESYTLNSRLSLRMICSTPTHIGDNDKPARTVRTKHIIILSNMSSIQFDAHFLLACMPIGQMNIYRTLIGIRPI